MKITDNGTGIPHAEFAERLTAFGASKKRGTGARGFRGVGRLAGIGYCQELVFRSRVAGRDQGQRDPLGLQEAEDDPAVERRAS